MKKEFFEYKGFHFEPFASFKAYNWYRYCKKEKRFNRICSLTLYSELFDREEWNMEEFYKASGNSKMDVFKCKETGKLYVPGSGFLFLFFEDEYQLKHYEAEIRIAQRDWWEKEKILQSFEEAMNLLREDGVKKLENCEKRLREMKNEWCDLKFTAKHPERYLRIKYSFSS